MSSKIKVLMDPVQRDAFVQSLIHMDGLGSTREDPAVGYGIIALTGLGTNLSPANEQVKTYLGNRQSILRLAMGKAGITLYDPASAPYSPDVNLTASPRTVFMVDTARVAMARHVSFTDVIASTGSGIELEKARRFGKFIYVFHDPEIRTSRMQPDRTLHLVAQNFGRLQNQFIELFQFMQEYDPCIGFDGDMPAMLGAHKQTGSVVNLEEAVARRWPDLMYEYDGTKPLLMMACLNPDLFLEHNGVTVSTHQLVIEGAGRTSDTYSLVISSLGEDVVDAVLVSDFTGLACDNFNPFDRARVDESSIIIAAKEHLHLTAQAENGIGRTAFNISSGATHGQIISPHRASSGISVTSRPMDTEFGITPMASFRIHPVSGMIDESYTYSGAPHHAQSWSIVPRSPH